MSESNPFSSQESDKGGADSSVFLDLNKPDEATGIPSVGPGQGQSGSGGGFIPASSEPSKFSGQVILAGLVFAIGVGSIYAMRYIGMQAGIDEQLSAVEYTTSTNTPDFIERFETVMSDLEEVSVTVQFEKGTKLPMAPFTMASTAKPAEVVKKPTTHKETKSERKARLAREKAEKALIAQEAKEAEIEAIAYTLNLQSVMGGTRPVVRISSKPYAIGMKIKGTLEVLSVDGISAILGYEDMRFKLTIGAGVERIDK